MAGMRSADSRIGKPGVAMVQFHIADTVPGKNFGMYATMSLVANVTLVAASLVVPFVTSRR
jgi:hypothetical protein